MAPIAQSIINPMNLVELQASADSISALLDKLEEADNPDDEEEDDMGHQAHSRKSKRVGQSHFLAAGQATDNLTGNDRWRLGIPSKKAEDTTRKKADGDEDDNDFAEVSSASNSDESTDGGFLEFEEHELRGFDNFNCAQTHQYITALLGKLHTIERLEGTHAISDWFSKAADVSRDTDKELDDKEEACIAEFNSLDRAHSELQHALEGRDINSIEHMRRFYNKVLALKSDIPRRRAQQSRKKGIKSVLKGAIGAMGLMSSPETRMRQAQDRRRLLLEEMEQANSGDKKEEAVQQVNNQKAEDVKKGRTEGARSSLLASELLEVISSQQDEIAHLRTRADMNVSKAEAMRQALEYVRLEREEQEAASQATDEDPDAPGRIRGGPLRKKQKPMLSEVGQETLDQISEAMRLKAIAELLMSKEGRHFLEKCGGEHGKKIIEAHARSAELIEECESLQSQLIKLQDQIDAVGDPRDREEHLRNEIAKRKEQNYIDSGHQHTPKGVSAYKPGFKKKGKKKVSTLSSAEEEDASGGGARQSTQDQHLTTIGEDAEVEDEAADTAEKPPDSSRRPSQSMTELAWVINAPMEVQQSLANICGIVEKTLDSVHEKSKVLGQALEDAKEAAVEDELEKENNEGHVDFDGEESSKKDQITHARARVSEKSGKLEDLRTEAAQLHEEEGELKKLLVKLRKMQKDGVKHKQSKARDEALAHNHEARSKASAEAKERVEAQKLQKKKTAPGIDTANLEDGDDPSYPISCVETKENRALVTNLAKEVDVLDARAEELEKRLMDLIALKEKQKVKMPPPIMTPTMSESKHSPSPQVTGSQKSRTEGDAATPASASTPAGGPLDQASKNDELHQHGERLKAEMLSNADRTTERPGQPAATPTSGGLPAASPSGAVATNPAAQPGADADSTAEDVATPARGGPRSARMRGSAEGPRGSARRGKVDNATDAEAATPSAGSSTTPGATGSASATSGTGRVLLPATTDTYDDGSEIGAAGSAASPTADREAAGNSTGVLGETGNATSNDTAGFAKSTSRPTSVNRAFSEVDALAGAEEVAKQAQGETSVGEASGENPPQQAQEGRASTTKEDSADKAGGQRRSSTNVGRTKEDNKVVVDKREEQVQELLFYQSENNRLAKQIAHVEKSIKEAKLKSHDKNNDSAPRVASRPKDTNIPEENKNMRREVVKRQKELNELRRKWQAEKAKHNAGAYDGTAPGQVVAAMSLLLREAPDDEEFQALKAEEARKKEEEQARKEEEDAAKEDEDPGEDDGEKRDKVGAAEDTFAEPSNDFSHGNSLMIGTNAGEANRAAAAARRRVSTGVVPPTVPGKLSAAGAPGMMSVNSFASEMSAAGRRSSVATAAQRRASVRRASGFIPDSSAVHWKRSVTTDGPPEGWHAIEGHGGFSAASTDAMTPFFQTRRTGQSIHRDHEGVHGDAAVDHQQGRRRESLLAAAPVRRLSTMGPGASRPGDQFERVLRAATGVEDLGSASSAAAPPSPFVVKPIHMGTVEEASSDSSPEPTPKRSKKTIKPDGLNLVGEVAELTRHAEKSNQVKTHIRPMESITRTVLLDIVRTDLGLFGDKGAESSSGAVGPVAHSVGHAHKSAARWLVDKGDSPDQHEGENRKGGSPKHHVAGYSQALDYAVQHPHHHPQGHHHRAPHDPHHRHHDPHHPHHETHLRDPHDKHPTARPESLVMEGFAGFKALSKSSSPERYNFSSSNDSAGKRSLGARQARGPPAGWKRAPERRGSQDRGEPFGSLDKEHPQQSATAARKSAKYGSNEQLVDGAAGASGGPASVAQSSAVNITPAASSTAPLKAATTAPPELQVEGHSSDRRRSTLKGGATMTAVSVLKKMSHAPSGWERRGDGSKPAGGDESKPAEGSKPPD